MRAQPYWIKPDCSAVANYVENVTESN